MEVNFSGNFNIIYYFKTLTMSLCWFENWETKGGTGERSKQLQASNQGNAVLGAWSATTTT